LLELITAVVVVVVRSGGYNEEAPVMTVVAEVTPSNAPVAAKVPNTHSTKVANAGTHTATAEPAAKGGTVRAAATMETAATVAAASTVASTVTATSNGGIEWNRDGQSSHGY
jgi:hypothetical protein